MNIFTDGDGHKWEFINSGDFWPFTPYGDIAKRFSTFHNILGMKLLMPRMLNGVELVFMKFTRC